MTSAKAILRVGAAIVLVLGADPLGNREKIAKVEAESLIELYDEETD